MDQTSAHRCAGSFLTLAFLAIVAAAIPGFGSAETPATNSASFTAERLADLPDPLGRAAGAVGVSNGALIYAGGTNFPEKKPWEGGTKAWHDEIYVLTSPKGTWRQAGHLPRALGHAASVTMPQGVICIGGSDGGVDALADVLLLTWQNGAIEQRKLPPLPKPSQSGAAAVIGNTIYFAGGTTTTDPVGADALTLFCALNLDDLQPAWRELPSWPGQGRYYPIAASDGQSFYLFSGMYRAMDSDGKPQIKFLSDAWRYTPSADGNSAGKWMRLADMPAAKAAAPSPASLVGDGLIAIFGGGVRPEDIVPPMAQRGNLSSNIVAYDTRADRWLTLGQAPAPRCAVPATQWNEATIIPSGEVKAGIRSSEVWSYRYAADAAEGRAGLRWWKGNLHTHTFWSDGDDFPEMVAQWYRDRGYHFLGLSDHNALSQGKKWMTLADVTKRGKGVALEKYLKRFGEDWVEMRGDGSADSPRQVRIKPLGEFRALVEERERFIMIQAEEISDAFEKLPIHVNGTNLLEVIPPQHGGSVAETIENNIRAIDEQSQRSGQEMLGHLNHPNFHWAVTAEDIAEAVSDRFFEVFNGHPSVRQLGDETHVSIERMWDIANTLRMKQFHAAPLYALATDDSHNYHVTGMSRSAPGRGWIMVRASRLTPESLIRAMKAGDFYASTGVTLRDVRYSSSTGELSIEIEPDGDTTFTTRFVGSARDVDTTSRPAPTTQRVTKTYSAEIGKTFATAEGLKPTYKLTGSELYVRAIITSSRPHDNPVYENQPRQAWTQPIGWQPAP